MATVTVDVWTEPPEAGMAAYRYPPNRHLAWQRLQRGWSYEELAERVRRAMDEAGETDTGLSANTVRRWETGERWPDPRYRKHLVAILGKPASELGLLTPDELRQRPDPDLSTELRRLLDVAPGTTGEGGIDRAAILRGLLGLGALPVLTPLLALDSNAQPHGGTGHAEAYGEVTRQHRALYWTCAPRTFFESIYAHAQLGVSLMRAAADPRLAAALAESALLAGRLAFFDLGQPALASRCYDVALSASREANDHALAAAALGHAAFIPGFARDRDGARNLLDAALQHTWHGVSPTVRSWLHCIGSETEARAGAGAAARRQIELAENALHDDDTPPEWLDFYGTSRLASFAGYAALADGTTTEAIQWLTTCLDSLGDGDGKQRSVVLADLATAHAGDPDRVVSYLGHALDALGTDWYGTGLDRVRVARASLGDSRQATGLDERIALLATVGRPAIDS